MFFCDNCGAKLSPGAVFCEECGTRVASGTAHGKAVFCEECGSRILPGAAFCEECGTRVAPAPEPVPLSKQIKMASVKAVYCEECGTKLLPGACFCEECGTRVPNMDAPVQKQPEKGFLFDGVDGDGARPAVRQGEELAVAAFPAAAYSPSAFFDAAVMRA